MKRTVKIKLSINDRKALEETIKQFKKACQMTVEEGWNENGLNNYKKYKLQKRVYDEIRETTDLQANLVVRAIARGAQAVKGCTQLLENGFKASKPNFTSDSMAYDKRTLSVYLDEERCTISTVNGRIDANFVLPEEKNDYYKEYLDDSWEITQSTIEKHEYEKENSFYLHLGLEKEDEEIEHKDPTVMGVDLGMNNLAVTSTGKFFKGNQLDHNRKRFEEIRGKLQQKGTRSAHLVIQRMSERENRYACDTLHCISKELVEEAERNDVDIIAFENLKYIRERMPKNKWYHVWAFNKLYQYVEYKAKERGIQVKQINPKNTSRRCSKCGHTEKNNRNGNKFKCKHCGYELDADYNAAKNIGIKLLQRRQKSSAGAGNGQLALKSGTLKLNGDYSPTFLGQKWSSLASSRPLGGRS
ncbi:MAG: transposase [Candidatus Thermoplasmatota archaeon]